MKCVILAAGFATRLYPLTKNKAKTLLPIAGRPIIEHIIEKLGSYISEVYIITNNKFYNDFANWLDNYKSHIKINLVNDEIDSNEKRLGALGDLKFVLDKFNIKEEIIVVAGDNLFNFDFYDFVKFFKEKGTCIALHDVKDKELAKHYGIIKLEGDIIKDFQEKPHHPKSTIASTGIYFVSKEDLKELNKYIEVGNLDGLGYFMQYLEKMKDVYGFVINGDWYDIGTLQQYKKANKEWKN